MVDAAKLARAGYTYIGRLYSEMDCQEFVERCLRDCGLKINLKGSNAWYRKMTWTGSPEECTAKFGKIPPGAFLFIVAHDGGEAARGYHDGKGNASHIGIYTGTRQGAIHSSQSRGSVVESRFSGKTIPNGGWNAIGLWDQVSYDICINNLLNGSKNGGEEINMDKATISGGNVGKPVNVRAAASSSASIVGTIPQGAEVEILEGGGKWNWVKYGNLVGYVMSEFVHSAAETDTGETVTVSRAKLQAIYDGIGDLLGIKG